MKIAVIGSRTLTVRNLEKYIPKDTTITYCFRHSKVMRTNKNASEPCSGDRCNSFIILFFKSYTIGNHIGTTVLKIRTEQIPQVKPKIIPAITSVR